MYGCLHPCMEDRYVALDVDGLGLVHLEGRGKETLALSFIQGG